MKLTVPAFAATLSLLSVGSLMADQTTVCVHADMERIISVVYANPNSAVPCEVVYQKPEGVQSLWRAEAEEGYCEQQAEALIEKQRNWGWECSMIGSAEVVAEQSSTAVMIDEQTGAAVVTEETTVIIDEQTGTEVIVTEDTAEEMMVDEKTGAEVMVEESTTETMVKEPATDSGS